MSSTSHPSAPTTSAATSTLWLALASVYLIWGSTYLVMRWVVAELPPMLMGAMRFTAAGAILLTWARLRGAPWPSRTHWRNAAVIGALMFVGGNGVVALAERSISSGVAAVVCATMPLWLALMTVATGERMRGREILGQVLGFVGVVVLLGGQLGGAELGGTLLVVVSPLSWAAGSLLSRRLVLPAGPMAPALQMLCGGLLMAGIGLGTGERIHAVPSTGVIVGQLYLLVAGSLVAFSAYTWLLRNARPALATSYAFVNPPIAVLAGIAFGGEVVGGTLVIATALVVAAVALVVIRPSPSPAAPAAPAPLAPPGPAPR